MRIEVTDRDIQNGGRKNPWGCPVALALARTTGANVAVTPGRLVARGKVEVKEIRLPDACKMFVTEFDNGRRRGALAPFSFEVPDAVVAKWRKIDPVIDFDKQVLDAADGGDHEEESI